MRLQECCDLTQSCNTLATPRGILSKQIDSGSSVRPTVASWLYRTQIATSARDSEEGALTGMSATTKYDATRIVATVFGVLSGLGGIRHGIGEILQGNVAPDGIIIDSWVKGPIAETMDGEPGMTIVPNLMVTGILTIVISLAVIIWSIAFVQRPHGGLVLFLLSVGMLLVGGGFGPPVVGMLAGVAGMEINSPHTWWQTRASPRLRGFLAGVWPWIFGIGVINGLFLFVISLILIYLFEVNNADLFLNSFFLAVLFLLLAIFTGIAYDSQHRDRGRGSNP